MKKKHLLAVGFSITFILGIFYSCTKDVGPNPLLYKGSPYTDEALLDSCRKTEGLYYYKGNNVVIANDPNAGSPHGPFKLKFNSIANVVLTDGGKIPSGQTFPEGSMIIKETATGVYAYMYKKSGSWLWGEVNQQSGIYVHSINSDASVCTSCHNFAQRDGVFSFEYY